MIVRKMKNKFGDDKRISEIVRNESWVGNSSDLELKVSYSRTKTGLQKSKTKLIKSDDRGFRHSHDSQKIFKSYDINLSDGSDMVYRAAGTFYNQSEFDFKNEGIQEDSLESDDSDQ